MTPERRIERVRNLIEDVAADPNRFDELSPGERLIVGIAMDRIDLLQGDGISSIEQAQDRLAPEWITAIRYATQGV
jgi:hypothetical protein